MRGWIVATLAVAAAGCGERHGMPTRPSAWATPTTPSTPVGPGANGRFTWASISASRPLCVEITRQIGESWSLWLTLESQRDGVVMTLAEGPPDSAPPAEAPAVFTGTRNGNSISAIRTLPNGGLACPFDRVITPLVGGELSATLSGADIRGEYMEVYGAGRDRVVATFSFEARLPRAVE